jgi:hypothetical protein
MLQSPKVTLVTEAYNLAEGQSEAAARRADVEVIVLDPSENNIAEGILRRSFPAFRSLHAKGMTYDGQKNLAAQMGRGEFLVFLDGDCVPLHDEWLERSIAPLARDPKMTAAAGLTVYDDLSLTGQAMSVLDFGFLFEARPGQDIGCYASNNIAFRRSAYIAYPAPDDGVLRSYCYRHAQELLRAGKPVVFNPDAVALHELPNIETERLRRGWDHIAALWEDPVLPAAERIAYSADFARSILEDNLRLALARLDRAPAVLRVDLSQRNELAQEIHRLMQIDTRGVVEALKAGEADGQNRKTLLANQAIRSLNSPATLSDSRS